MEENNRKPLETIYTPESRIRKPHKLIRDMYSDIRASKELAWRLFIRNISTLYRQTVLGYIWAFLPPIATTLLWVFLNNSKVVSFASTSIPYPVYVMVGTLLWQVFIDAMNCPLKIVSSSKSMIIKINFPHEALIIAGLLEVFFNFLIRIILFVGILIFYKVSLSITVLLAPIGILSLILLGLMIGIFLTPIGVLYKDIGNALIIFTTIWFYLTPVIYPPPSSFPANLLVKLNPVSPLIITTRDWITSGSVTDLSGFLLISIISLLLIIIGWILFRISMPHIIERSGM